MTKKKPFVLRSHSNSYIEQKIKLPPAKYRELIALAKENKTSIEKLIIWAINACTE